MRPIQTWRGDPVFSNASAVDKQTFTYTLSGSQVTQNVATETVSATYTDSTTFNLGMDTVSRKTKVLSFVGMGVRADEIAWGQMIADARQNVAEAPWTLLAPMGAIFITVSGLRCRAAPN